MTLRRAVLAMLIVIAGASRSRCAVVTYGSYFGDGDETSLDDVVFDGRGGLIVAGMTKGTHLPVTAGAYQTTPGELFAARIDLGAGCLDWCTCIGGPDPTPNVETSLKRARLGLALDGSIWIAVSAEPGSVKPIIHPVQATFTTGVGENDEDAWIGRLSVDGTTMLYGTWFGGPGAEEVHDLAVAPDGDVVVVGTVTRGETPQVHPVQPVPVLDPGDFIVDGFAVRLAADGGSIRFATHLGGVSSDEIAGVAVDSSGKVHVVGDTISQDFPRVPATGPQHCGCWQGFVAVIEPGGDVLSMSRLTASWLSSVAADGAGRSYVFGSARSGADPVVNAFDDPTGGADNYVARVLPDASIDFGATFGDAQLFDYPTGALDASLTFHVGGVTGGNQPTTSDAAQSDRLVSPGRDVGALLRINADAGTLEYGSYVGGHARTLPPSTLRPPWQRVRGIDCSADGSTAVVGTTWYEDFPTTSNAVMPTMPVRADGLAYLAGFVQVTGPAVYVNAYEPSAVDLNSRVAPLQVHRQGPAVLVGWDETLGGKFGLYQGSLANLRTGLYDHVPVAGGCSVDHPPAWIPMPPGDVYFIASAMSSDEESSHGRDSFARERPHGPSPCR